MRILKQPSFRFQKAKLVFSSLFLAVFFLLSQGFNASEQPLNSELAETNGEGPKAEFPGGKRALFDFFNKNLQVPKDLKGTSKVMVEFVVNENGKCSDFTIIKSAGEELDNAALTCMKKMPDWLPAEKEGNKVSSKITLPIVFTNEKTGCVPTVPFNSIFQFPKEDAC